MKQLIQNFKTGELYVDDVPMPALSKGMILVENKFSLISPGTEKGTVEVGKANIIDKARQRPDLVSQVFRNVKKEGIKATFKKVQTKLDTYKALGYSTAGIVKASMDTNNLFKPGDRVACAGQDHASHAEIISVPQNLVVGIPEQVGFEEAAFTTLGAIAMQGVRQADPKIGENIIVIGLGLLGQLTLQILKANGCNVAGVDLDDQLVKIGLKTGLDLGLSRNEKDLIKILDQFTTGKGADKIIITAGTDSNDPIELAVEVAGNKATIVVVGAVKMDVPRDPHFYKKELELTIARSYGPGRYDFNYEEKGIDYPFEYVRWTAQRNMQAFLGLVAQKKVLIEPIISHTFELEQAEEAFDLVLNKKGEFSLGILLSYPSSDTKSVTQIRRKMPTGENQLNIGFIGAGSFAQSYLIPPIKKYGAYLSTVVTTKGITSKNVAEKFDFEISSTSPEDLLNNDKINTVFIATRHDTHAEYALQCLKSGKNTFIEKPLALNQDDLKQLKEEIEKSDKQILVGYNRRFSKAAEIVKEELEAMREPVIMNFRINAGKIEGTHWIQDPEIGGGRIIGETCHFIDLMQFFAGKPKTVFAQGITGDSENLRFQDNLTFVISFENGSIGTCTYTSIGNDTMPKEYMEFFSGGKSIVINDFKSVTVYHNSKRSKHNVHGKGHGEEIKSFLDVIKMGGKRLIPLESLYYTSMTTFKIKDSLITGLPQDI